MTVSAIIRQDREGGGASTFAITRRHGVWRVARDGAFYGDYPVRQSAIEAAQTAAALPLTRGAPAHIHISDEDI